MLPRPLGYNLKLAIYKLLFFFCNIFFHGLLSVSEAPEGHLLNLDERQAIYKLYKLR